MNLPPPPEGIGIKFTADIDMDNGDILLSTHQQDMWGNYQKLFATEVMRTKDNCVKAALIKLGWTPPPEKTP